MRLWNSFEVKALWFRIQMRTRHCVLEFGLVSFSFSFFFSSLLLMESIHMGITYGCFNDMKMEFF